MEQFRSGVVAGHRDLGALDRGEVVRIEHGQVDVTLAVVGAHAVEPGDPPLLLCVGRHALSRGRRRFRRGVGL